MSELILVVEHEAICPPGWVGEWLEASGATLDLRRPYAGDDLPATLGDHDGMVVLGGSMGAYDDAGHPWLTRVKELVREAAATDVPTWGICLGHQLCAVALGGEVVRNPRGQQVGVLEVGWTDAAAGDRLFGTVSGPARGAQWNNDVVSRLPDGSVLLAATPHGEVQAARFTPTVWGVQWHPEAGGDIIRVWADDDRDAATERGIDVYEYLDHVIDAEPELQDAWRPLAASFVARTRDRAPALP